MVKVVGWYDNEWGYSCRVGDLANAAVGSYQGLAVIKQQYDPARHGVMSNASCTTNCIAIRQGPLQNT